jgi:hypothetical protein
MTENALNVIGGGNFTEKGYFTTREFCREDDLCDGQQAK